MTEIELLRFAVKANPPLAHAVQMTLKIRSAAQFPIGSEDALLGLLEEGTERIDLDDTSFTKAQLRTFFPMSFYPITSDEDLFGKMYAALMHGRTVHELEDQIRVARKHILSLRRGK